MNIHSESNHAFKRKLASLNYLKLLSKYIACSLCVPKTLLEIIPLLEFTFKENVYKGLIVRYCRMKIIHGV